MSWEVKNSSFFIEKIFIKITKILEKIMLNQASIIIAVSSVLKDELEKKDIIMFLLLQMELMIISLKRIIMI